MPHVLFMTDKAVFVVCEHVPVLNKGENEAELTAEVDRTICTPRCGYKKDTALRHLKLYCFSPQSPYLQRLEELKQQLKAQVQK